MRKVVLGLSIAVVGVSSCLAMSTNNKVEESTISKQGESNDYQKLVDIYLTDDEKSAVSGTITLNNQDNYNVFYCKQNNWCEVVEINNGKVGWVSLDKLKQAQEKYAKQMYKKNTIDQVVAYTKQQDQKIIQLQTAMMQMQKEFSQVLQQQQSQINQLKQVYYYQ